MPQLDTEGGDENNNDSLFTVGPKPHEASLIDCIVL